MTDRPTLPPEVFRCYGGPLDGAYVALLQLQSLRLLNYAPGSYEVDVPEAEWPEWVKQRVAEHPVPRHTPAIWRAA